MKRMLLVGFVVVFSVVGFAQTAAGTAQQGQGEMKGEVARAKGAEKKAPGMASQSGMPSARETGSGMATGRRNATAQSTNGVKTPRDIATGQASGKMATSGDSSANSSEQKATINTSRSNIKH